MKYVMYIILASVMLSGCAKTNSYYPRPYGEDWKVLDHLVYSEFDPLEDYTLKYNTVPAVSYLDAGTITFYKNNVQRVEERDKLLKIIIDKTKIIKRTKKKIKTIY